MSGGGRSSSDRSRATRLRQRRAAGRALSREESAWLRAYEAETRRRERERARRKNKKKKKGRPKVVLPPKPRKVRARTPAERSRAARLRARLAAGADLSAADRRWLDRYEAAVDRARRVRHARSRRARLRSAREAAGMVVTRIAQWLGSYEQPEVSWSRAPTRGERGTGTAQVPVTWDLDPGAPIRGQLPEGRPDLQGTLAPGDAMTVQVEIARGRWRRWVVVVAFTPDVANAEQDLVDALDDVGDTYSADAITAVGAYVGSY